MIILGIESSCDDTSIALLNYAENGCIVLSEKTASQIEIHKKYGGVVPEIAGRLHAEKIIPLIEEVLKDQPKPETIAVTAGPGLITGLIVGIEAARTLSFALDIPLVAVNHLEGHIYSVEIQNTNSNMRPINQLTNKLINYPALALIVSGGHTELVYIPSAGEYEIIGATKDDAAGECFDKIAKLLDLPYPGGPQISTLAQTGKTDAINFPRPMINEPNFDFSFSGLKTSALYWLRDNKLSADKIISNNLPTGIFGQMQNEPTRADFCASFEQAIIDVLIEKTLRAAKKYNPKTIILGGGVSANKKLRATLSDSIKNNFPETKFLFPDQKYCMDNAAMIAVAGYYQTTKNNFTNWKEIKADPQLKLKRFKKFLFIK